MSHHEINSITRVFVLFKPPKIAWWRKKERKLRGNCGQEIENREWQTSFHKFCVFFGDDFFRIIIDIEYTNALYRRQMLIMHHTDWHESASLDLIYRWRELIYQLKILKNISCFYCPHTSSSLLANELNAKILTTFCAHEGSCIDKKKTCVKAKAHIRLQSAFIHALNVK